AEGYELAELPAGLGAQPFVTDVLAGVQDATGDKFSGLASYTTGEVLLLSGPVTQADGTLAGVLLVGASVERLADDLRQESLGQISFYRPNGQVLASSLSQPRALTSVQAAEVLDTQASGSLILPLSDSSVSYNELLSAWQVRA